MNKTVYDFVSEASIRRLFDDAIDEDGARSDLTSLYTIDENARGIARIRAKQELVLCGIDAAALFFKWFDPTAQFEKLRNDGDVLVKGDVAATITGSMRTLLAVERSALNLLQHLSGIATKTGAFVSLISGTGAKMLDTRKTLPGYRMLQKYAVYCGGGENHRLGLHDAVLIKDNHVESAGGVGRAVILARTKGGPDLFIEVEVRTPQELEEAMDAGADRALLDNMSPEVMRRCVGMAKGRISTEASGNVDIGNVAEIAATGVDYISSGALTHSPKAADLNMKIEPIPSGQS